jgi:hypothetical protein
MSKIKSFADHLLISTPPERSLGCFFTKLKEKTPTELQSQLIYKVPCLACLKYYLGMTWKQYFNTRLVQHDRQQNRILRGEIIRNKTAITDHVSHENHRFDFSHATIVDKSNNYHRLKILEMLHISANQNACNYRSDVSNTIQQYQSLLLTLRIKNLI